MDKEMSDEINLALKAKLIKQLSQIIPRENFFTQKNASKKMA